jgi:hypothetical protein
MSQCGFLVQITLFHIRGYAANSGLDALFYKTKLSRRNCSIFFLCFRYTSRLHRYHISES